MRTLKKTLCLVLALVMCLGMFTVAFADNGNDNLSKFTDVADVNYKEAADYLVAAGVVHGVGGNRLNPNGTLTRAEAATLVAYMLLGKEAADAYKPTELPFTDVSKNHWAAGYIQFCSNQGIISGRGNGIFDPDANVTGLEMASMLLRALGYGGTKDPSITWPAGVQAKSLELGMFDEIISAANLSAINRDKTFQMVFNAMTGIATVQYNASYQLYFTGTTFNTEQAFKAGDEDWTENNTLGYKTANMESQPTDDDLGYAMREWKNRKSGQVVTNEYPAYDVLVNVEPNSNAKTLSKRIEVDATNGCEIWLNGGQSGAADKKVDGTTNTAAGAAGLAVKAAQNGFTVQMIDIDDNGMADRIIIVVEYIAEVTNVTAASGPNPAKATLKVFGSASQVTIANTNISAEDFAIVNTLKKGDIVKVVPQADATPTLTLNANPADAAVTMTVKNAAPISIETITPVESAVTSFEGKTQETDENTASVTFGGVVYNYSAVAPVGAAAPFIAKNGYTINANNTYDFYFNSSNRIIGVTAHKVEDTIPNVVYITAVESKQTGNSLFGSTVGYAVKAKGVLVNGKEVEFNLKLTENKGAELIKTTTSLDGKTVAVYDSVAVSTKTLTAGSGIQAKEEYLAIYNGAGTTGMIFKLTNMGAWEDVGDDADGNDKSMIAQHVFAYSTDDEGMTTLTSLPKTANGVTYDGGTVGVCGADDTTLEVKKNVADVKLGTMSGTTFTAGSAAPLFATTKTNLVVVDSKGVATTYTGYDKFPGDPNAKDFEVGDGNDKADAIFYVTTKNPNDPKTIVTDIVVLGYDEPQAAGQDMLLAATGNWRDVEGKDGQNATEWEFVNAATGESAYYALKNGGTIATAAASGLAANTVYKAKVEPTGLDGSAVTAVEVLQVTDTWIRVKASAVDGDIASGAGNILYLNGVTPYELSPGYPVATLKARVPSAESATGSAIAGSSVYALYETTGPNAYKLAGLFVAATP